MSKKKKIVYSDIQPNAKEAGVWVNTTDGNVKIEKDGKWVDDSGSSSGLKYLPKYYSIDWSVADEGWTAVLTDGNMNRIASTVNGGFLIAAYIPPFEIKAFSFLPVGFQNQNTFDVNFFETLESVIDYINGNTDFSISMNGIKEISEEEYYSFNVADREE